MWSCHPIHERTLLRFQWVLQVRKSRSCSNELMNFRHWIYKCCDLDNLQQSVKWNYNHKQALPWTLKHKIQNTLKWVSVLRQFSLKMMFGEQNSMLWHSDQHTINYYHVMMIFFEDDNTLSKLGICNPQFMTKNCFHVARLSKTNTTTINSTTSN